MQATFSYDDYQTYADQLEATIRGSGLPKAVRTNDATVNMGKWSIHIDETVLIYPNDGKAISFACNLLAMLEWCHVCDRLEFQLRRIKDIPGIEYAKYIGEWLDTSESSRPEKDTATQRREQMVKELISKSIGIDLSELTAIKL